MTRSASYLRLLTIAALLAGTGLVSGCGSPDPTTSTTTTEQTTTAPAPPVTSSTTTTTTTHQSQP
jgi:hypothetical protein